MIKRTALYFPTYRRIEEDLSKLGLDVDKDNLKNKLIQFGMSDVENRINKILKTIRMAAMTGFTKMTGVLLKQYLDNEIVDNKKQSIDEEKLNIALDRIGEEIEQTDKIRIVVFTKFTQNKQKFFQNLFCFYEGKIEEYTDISHENIIGYNCGGKDNELFEF